MKFKKGQTLVIGRINDHGRIGLWLVGHDGYVFHELPKCKVYRHDEAPEEYQRDVIYIMEEKTFDYVKKEKVIAESLFPYDKEYKDLEKLEWSNK